MFTKRVISCFMSFLFIVSLLLAQSGPAYATDTDTVIGTATMLGLAEPYQAPYYLKASPAEDWVHARGWLEGTPLDLTIRNAADTLSYSTSAFVAQAPWNPSGPDDQTAIFELNGDWDVQVGDVVTVTDGVKEETLTVVDTTQLHWLSGNDNTEGVTAQQDAAHSYNLANPEIELLFIVGWPGENADYPADIFGPQGIKASNAFKGEWLDLDPLITSSGYDTSQFAPQLMELYYNDDEGQYGLPFLVFPNLLYYQKGMFDSAGLNYPPANYGDAYVLDGEPVEWSIAAMNEVAKRLTLDNTGKNATQPGFDPNNIVQYGYVPQWQSATAIGSLWGSATIWGGTPGAYTASIPTHWALAWKSFYNGMWGQGPFIPNDSAIYSPEFGQGNAFNSGKIAMATVQSWYLCCIGDAGTNWEFGAVPSYEGTVHGVFHADSFRIFKNTPHQQEAFDVLMYLNDNTNLLETYDQMPAHTSKQADFLIKKEAQYPFVDNWHLLQDGLNYIDNPNHEGWMPNYATAWEYLNQFRGRLTDKPGLNMDDEIEKLRWGLEHIFNTGEDPGWPKPAVFSKSAPANGASDQSLFLTLSWQSSASAASYEYCIDTSNDNACASWVSTGTSTLASLSGLKANTTYYWQVRATNVDGTTYANGSAEAFWSFTTGEATGTFPDVPTDHWAWAFIERLANAGITSGFPDGTYRPAASVTRGQMAVFLLKAMHYPGSYSPPNVDPTFSDTADHWAEDWIEALKASGITGGFPDGTFRPENPVTRAQMSIFLLKAINGPGYTPPPAAPTFDDTAEHWASDWIEALRASGLTGGYPDGTYRPDNPVTRAEMAVFIVNAFGLP